MGEVSGNWTDTGSRPVGNGQLGAGSGTERGISVNLSSLRMTAGKDVIIPITVVGARDKEIIAYELDLRYDPAVMRPQKDAVDLAQTVSRGLVAVVNAETPGLLRVVMYGAYPIERDGVLLNVRFDAIGAPGAISPLSFERIIFNEGEPRVTANDGRIELL